MVLSREKRIEKEKLNSPSSQNTLSNKFNFNVNDSESESESENELNDVNGLNSGLKSATPTQNTPIGSTEVESFLKEIERELIAQVQKEEIQQKPRDKIILQLLKKPKNSEKVVIATNNNIFFQCVPVSKYNE